MRLSNLRLPNAEKPVQHDGKGVACVFQSRLIPAIVTFLVLIVPVGLLAQVLRTKSSTVLLPSANRSQTNCISPDPPEHNGGSASTSSSVTDLILQMRDVQNAISVSPDGKWVAFTLVQANVHENRWHTGLYVVGTEPKSHIRSLGCAGEIQMASIGSVPEPNPPTWSPDSRYITYVMREQGGHRRLQLFRFDRSGGPPLQLTHEDRDVLYGVWSSHGEILYSELKDRPDRLQLIEQYMDRGIWYFGLSSPTVPLNTPGFLSAYDASKAPIHNLTGSEVQGEGSVSPWLSSSGEGLIDNAVDRQYKWGELGSGRFWLGSDYAIHCLGCEKEADANSGHTAPAQLDTLYQESVNKDRHWEDPSSELDTLYQESLNKDRHWKDPSSGLSYQLEVFDNRISPSSIPQGYYGRRAIVASSSGDKASFPVTSALYSYGPCSFSVHAKIFACVREGPTEPPEIVSLNVTEHSERVLTHLNPEVDGLTVSSPELVEWPGEDGKKNHAFLYRPSGEGRGPFPTVLLPYYAGWEYPRAYLNEFPISVLVAKGFAVLELDILPQAPWGAGREEYTKMARRVVETVKKAVALLVGRGITDVNKVGVGGHSYGDMAVDYCIARTHEFQAAAATASGMNSTWFYLQGQRMQLLRFADFGGTPLDANNALQEWSAAYHAASVTTPLLINTTEVEYMMSLQTAIELRFHHKPVEMVIFPEGSHAKRWPRQIRSAWELNVDWFCFWLKGEEDSSPTKAEQYLRWRRLKKLQGGACQRL